jgi:hypothetical protein
MDADGPAELFYQALIEPSVVVTEHHASGCAPATTIAGAWRIPRSADSTLTLGEGSLDCFSDRLTRIGALVRLRTVAAYLASAGARVAEAEVMAVSVDNRPARSRSALAALLTVLILVPTGYLFFRVWQHNDDERDSTKLEKQGVEYVTSLSPLISGIAESESSALQGVAATPASLTTAVARVAAVDQRLGDALQTHERWAGLRDRISKLPNASAAGPQAAFQAHVEAADLALALYSTVRSNSTLIRDPDNDLSHLQQAAAVDLPTTVVQVNRMGDLALQLAQAGAARNTVLLQQIGAQFAASLGTVQASVGSLTDELQAAVDDTNSETLSGSLVSSLDSFRRGVESLTRGANPGGAPDTAAMATAQTQLQTSLNGLSGVLVREMTGLLDKRIDSVDNQRIEALAAAALVLVLMLAAAIVRSTGRRRRVSPAPLGPDTGRGATTNRTGPPPGYGSLMDPPGYGAGDPTRRERSGAVR